nr:MAG TPA: hypothetical protein [Caudoviricetes sp.]
MIFHRLLVVHLIQLLLIINLSLVMLHKEVQHLGLMLIRWLLLKQIRVSLLRLLR